MNPGSLPPNVSIFDFANGGKAVVDANGNVVGYIDANGNFVPAPGPNIYGGR